MMTNAIFWLALLAYVTHIIASLGAGNVLFALVGGVIFPVGIVHGLSVWFTI